MKEDGTVLVAGDDRKGQKEAEKWQDIVSVSVGPGVHYRTQDGRHGACGRTDNQG